MKKLITEISASITGIAHMNGDDADQFVLDCRNDDFRQGLADGIKSVLGEDDVKVTGIKAFINDMTDHEDLKEVTSETRVKITDIDTVSEDELDDIIAFNKTTECVNLTANAIKEALGADDVVVSKITQTVGDEE